jgi:hypothetical protein
MLKTNTDTKIPGVMLMMVMALALVACSKPMHKQHQSKGITSLDIYQDGVYTHLLVGRESATEKVLLYQVSSDGGGRWSEPVAILGDNHLPVKMGRGRDAQIAAQNNTVIVLWTKYTDSNRFHTGPMQAARSQDGGKTWRSIDAPPDWQPGPHGFADLTTGDKGFEAVWLDSRYEDGQGLRYAYSDNNGDSWSENLTLDEKSCSCCWNTIKNDGDGQSYVVYRDKEPSDMSIGVMDKQNNWRYLSHVGQFGWFFQGCPHIGAGMDFQTVAGKKLIHVIVGTGKTDVAGVYHLVSEDGGQHWSEPIRLGDDSATHADIAASDDGKVVAVWDMMTETGMAVFLAESMDQGKSWGAARQLSQQGVRATHPKVVATPSGFLAVWTAAEAGLTQLKSLRLTR